MSTLDGSEGSGPRAEQRLDVEAALAQVVADFGRLLSRDPTRLRNLLNDVLGPRAVSVRSELNAVVAAAESGGPDRILSGESTDTIIERLVSGGVERPLADWALASWAKTLRVDGESPTTTRTDHVPTTPRPGDDSGQGVETGRERSEKERRSVSPIAIAGAALVAVLLIVAFMVMRGGSDAEADPTVPTSVAGPTSTSMPAVTRSGLPTTMASGLSQLRRLTFDDDGLTVLVELENRSGAPVTDRLVEVLPDRILGGSVQFASAPTETLRDGQAFAFAVDLAAGKGFKVQYTVRLDAMALTSSDLETILAMFDPARDAWLAGPGDVIPPVLTVTSPVEGPSTMTSELLGVAGTTEVGATLTVNGAPVTVGADGSFMAAFTLSTGDNTVTVEATDPNGNKATVARQVTFAPPAAPEAPAPEAPAPEAPAPAPPPRPKTIATTTTTTTVAEPTTTTAPTTTTTPPPPANTAPVLSCAAAYINVAPNASSWVVWANYSCFSDAETSFEVVTVTGNTDGTIVVDRSFSQCTASRACWRYYPIAGWDGVTQYSDYFSIYARDPQGLRSDFLTIFLNVGYS